MGYNWIEVSALITCLHGVMKHKERICILHNLLIPWHLHWTNLNTTVVPLPSQDVLTECYRITLSQFSF